MAGLLAGGLLLMGSSLREQLQGPLRGGRAPDFALTTFDGQQLRLSDHHGQVVLVNFWASWCLPCRDEAPLLEQAYRRHREEGLVVLGVNWVDTEPGAREFLRELGITYPNGPDVAQRVARSYRLSGIPETYFVDREGRIAYTHLGPLTEAVLRERLLPLLEGGGR